MKIKLTGANLVVNGETIENGGNCDVGEAEAMAMIDRGLAVHSDGVEETSHNDGDLSDEQRRVLIVETIRDMAQMDPDRQQAGDWTKSGLPDVRVVSDLVGFDIAATERDAAWKVVTEETGGIE